MLVTILSAGIYIEGPNQFGTLLSCCLGHQLSLSPQDNSWCLSSMETRLVVTGKACFTL